VDACRLLAVILIGTLEGAGKDAVLEGAEQFAERATLAPEICAIAQGSYRDKPRDAISGSGYVVHSLDAALWCFAQTGNFEEAILEAANLGEDADTTAAICGQIAGAHYGMGGIPQRWLEKLARKDEIEKMAVNLMAARPSLRSG
jgi:ADP-ribosyl-[dinitrogen reductase] hydrolase